MILLLVVPPAVMVGWALGAALDRLSPRLALALAGVLAVLASAPLPSPLALAAAVAGLVALPLGWGLRRRPAVARTLLPTLAGPARRALFWAPSLAPWIALGLALAALRVAMG